MSNKKRFTIAPDLASGIRNTIQSAATNQGQLHYDMMPLDILEPDPNNPRKLSISRSDIFKELNPTDSNYLVQLKDLESLRELSESIKKIGVKHAIEVYKEGTKYRIITGERRYLAAMLAGLKSVPVRISHKPDEFNLRYTQWVENINRQDLSLFEKFNNLILMAESYKKSHHDEFDDAKLQKLLGVSSVQAYRYFCLLKADEQIVELIQLGKLNNVKVVQELVSMKDKGARNQIISWIRASKGEMTSLANYREVAGKKGRASSTKKSAIQLGKINNSLLAKRLLDIILSDSKFIKYRHIFDSIDWTSATSISNAFKGVLKKMEKEFNTVETA